MSVRLGLVLLFLLVAAPAFAEERDLQQLHADVAAAWDGFRLDEASRLIAAGLADHPNDEFLLGLRGYEALHRGDEARARADAEAVLFLQPDDPRATALLQEIELGERARERLARTKTEFRGGSPQAHVDRLLEAVAAGASPEAIADAFDPEIVTWEPNPTRETLVASIGATLSRIRTTGAIERITALGWVVAPEPRADGQRRWVHADVVLSVVFTKARRATLERALRDPSLVHLLDPAIVSALLPLSPEQRATVLDALMGRRFRETRALEFELVRSGREWRIRDVRSGDVSMREDIATLAQLDGHDGPSPVAEQTPSTRRWGGIAGGVLAVALALLLRSWLKR